MEMNNQNKKPLMLLSAIGLFLVTKGKSIFALLKVSKFGGAFLSMLVSIWAYAIVFPVGFAIGLVVMIFIHELGHVIAARQKGLPVSAPLFIPFLGALITMKKYPRDAVTEAYIAMGGPVLGSLGALAALLLGMMWENELLVVIANVGFFINLINLLPIHPLDGGRISTAVTRWLWVVGLVGGLAVIVYLKSILLFVIWGMFAWELYHKYLKNKGKGKVHNAHAQLEVPFEYIVQQGAMIPGEEHRRELDFNTYSTLDGQQKLELIWDSIGLRQTINMPQQGLIRRVAVEKIRYEPQLAPTKMIVDCAIDYEFYENDKYYDVPTAIRWNFGLAYGGLAMALIYLLSVTSGLDMMRGNPM